jgi:hypothetical protein
MSCQDFDSVSIELARGSLIDAAARASALAHAEGCAACGGRLRRERALSDALGEVAAAMRDAQAPARVESALRAAFRERRIAATPAATNAAIPAATIESVRARRDMMSRATVNRRALVAAAVAASLVVVASVVAWRTLSAKTTVVETARQQADEPEVKSPTLASQPDITRVPDAPPTAPSNARQSSKASATYVARNLTRRRAPQSVEDLPVTFTAHGGRVYADAAATNSAVDPGASEGFVPLMTADGSAPLDGGQMVRVQMPRAALAAWGLPVNAERAGETVKADLLLAHDGTARAIRLRR